MTDDTDANYLRAAALAFQMDDPIRLRLMEIAERLKPLSHAQLDAAARDAQIKFCLKRGGSFEEEFARVVELAHGIGAADVQNHSR